MAGRGPAPDPGARRRVTGKVKDPIPTMVIEAEPLAEPLGPPLPVEFEWPKRGLSGIRCNWLRLTRWVWSLAGGKQDEH